MAKKKTVRKNPSAKRKAAARKAAATRAAKARKRSLAAKKAARTRKRLAARKNPARKVRRRKARRNPPPNTLADMKRGVRRAKKAARKRSEAAKKAAAKRKANRRKSTKASRSRAAKKAWATRRRRHPGRPATRKSMSRARKTIRSYKKTKGAASYMKKYKMRSNPAGIKDAVMKAIPIGVGYIGSKVIVNLGAKHIPGLDKLNVGGYDLAKPVLHIGAIAVIHFGTKKAPVSLKALKKHRDSLMLGAGLAALTSMVETFAPASVKEMLGMSSAVVAAAPAPSAGYFTTDDYMTVDGYVTVDDFESEMGAIEADLGLEADLGMIESDLGGGFADRNLGGVHRGSMLKAVPEVPMLAPVPARSFTGVVPEVGPGFDSHSGLYQGIFRGGYQ